MNSTPISKLKPGLTELEILQQEAASLRQLLDRVMSGEEEIDQPGADRSDDKLGLENVGPELGSSSEPDPENLQPENLGRHWARELETLVTELESSAAEHPRLALLAAFGLGVVAGQLLSRKTD